MELFSSIVMYCSMFSRVMASWNLKQSKDQPDSFSVFDKNIFSATGTEGNLFSTTQGLKAQKLLFAVLQPFVLARFLWCKSCFRQCS